MNTTLQTWLDQEAALKQLWATREVAGAGQPAGAMLQQAMATMTGLQQLQAMMRGEMPFASIGRTMDFLPVEMGEGVAVFQGAPGAGHLNPMGSVHGGWYATLLDSALGCCVHTCMPVGKGYTTLELKVNMIRALSPQVQRVRAIGRVIHVGGQTATSEARLEGPDGKLYAHGSTTCLVFDAKPRR